MRKQLAAGSPHRIAQEQPTEAAPCSASRFLGRSLLAQFNRVRWISRTSKRPDARQGGDDVGHRDRQEHPPDPAGPDFTRKDCGAMVDGDQDRSDHDCETQCAPHDAGRRSDRPPALDVLVLGHGIASLRPWLDEQGSFLADWTVERVHRGRPFAQHSTASARIETSCGHLTTRCDETRSARAK